MDVSCTNIQVLLDGLLLPLLCDRCVLLLLLLLALSAFHGRNRAPQATALTALHTVGGLQMSMAFG